MLSLARGFARFQKCFVLRVGLVDVAHVERQPVRGVVQRLSQLRLVAHNEQFLPSRLRAGLPQSERH